MTHILSVNTKLKAALTILLVFSTLTLTTISVVLAGGGEDPLSQEVADVAAPEIDDPIGDTELKDLQAVAEQFGISLQAAIDRYGWNNNFALAVSRIREAVPEDFTGAEIVDAGHAWVAFSGNAPQEALDILDTFSGSHRGVSVEVWTDRGFNETELQKAIEDVHYGTLSVPETRDASTSFDYETGQITRSSYWTKRLRTLIWTISGTSRRKVSLTPPRRTFTETLQPLWSCRLTIP